MTKLMLGSLLFVACTTVSIPREGMLVDGVSYACTYHASPAELACITALECQQGCVYVDRSKLVTLPHGERIPLP